MATTRRRHEIPLDTRARSPRASYALSLDTSQAYQSTPRILVDSNQYIIVPKAKTSASQPTPRDAS
jgi:hypothetical protein